MNILFYYPHNTRTIPIDVPLLALKKRGHEIFLLTMSPKGSLHEFYENNHIKPFEQKCNSKVKQVYELVHFCKTHRIDVIHSHLQQANLIALIASFFMKHTKVHLFRHHCKFHFLLNTTELRPPLKERLSDKIINLLSKQVIVPSSGVKHAMITHEGAIPSKIRIIPYMYHFKESSNLNQNEINIIKTSYPAYLRVIMVARLTPFKRHLHAIKPIGKLIQEGYSIQLLVMDDGPELPRLKSYVSQHRLTNSIHFLGFKKNIMNYIAACDIIIHPSLTEASNSAIKEAGFLRKAAIVCDRVGDFNDYITNNENGYLIDPNAFQEKAYDLLREMYENQKKMIVLGNNLHQSVMKKFSFSESVVDLYERL